MNREEKKEEDKIITHGIETQEKNIFNTLIIEKDKKNYKLTISKIDKDIIIKCRIEKPLKVFERKFTKSDLEKLGKIFKGCDNIKMLILI